MKFDESISYLLARVSVAHRKMLEKTAARIGLHGGQIFVLMELWKKDGLRQVDLAGRLDVAPPTVNKILGGLLEGDFVTRSKYEDDARSTRIFLTPKGVEAQAQLEAEWDVLEEHTTVNLTDTEVLVLKQLLARLLEQVEI
jgi:DNA-binding MarR family transcriptional regulator